MDPRNEREILDSSDKFAANDLKLGSAAHTVRLLVALETFELGGELGPLWGEARQGVQLRLLLQEPGAVHPLSALPPLLTLTCTRGTSYTIEWLESTARHLGLLGVQTRTAKLIGLIRMQELLGLKVPKRWEITD